MKIYSFFLFLILLSSCSKIPVPSTIAPSENTNVQPVSFGEEPTNYQNILKNYLIMNLKNYKTAKVEFSNLPSKFSIDHLGNNYSGYRVCLSINETRGEYYTGYKNHFFMIYNNKVNLHLYDSGLLTIPFSYCVSRNINNEYFIDDIPEQIEEISVDSMDSIELTQKENTNFQKLKNKFDKLRQENIELKKLNKDNSKTNEKNVNDLAKMDVPSEAYDDRDNIYISCIFDKISTTYIFNASEESFKLINKLDVVTYEVSFNDAFIVATNEALELTINRVTGKAALQGSIINKGMCNLADKTKF